VKRYEGLFILDTAGKEEGIKDVIDKISSEINSAAGKVEPVQKIHK
jgi:ribosomal protein S6